MRLEREWYQRRGRVRCTLTNHSLCATAVTRMYAKGVPEKLIAETSGHKSLKALRAYEQTSSVQEKVAGECIQLGKLYEEAQDSVKEEKPLLQLLWNPVKMLECPKGFRRQCNNFLDSTIVHSTFTALVEVC